MATEIHHDPLLTIFSSFPSLQLAKRYLDPLAAEVSEAQNERLKEHRKQRKRKRGEDDKELKPLQLKRVYLEGFKVDQVYEQVRRVLDATTVEAEQVLPELLHNGTKSEGQRVNGKTNGVKSVTYEHEGSDEVSEAESDVVNFQGEMLEDESEGSGSEDEDVDSEPGQFLDLEASEGSEDLDEEMEEDREEEDIEEEDIMADEEIVGDEDIMVEDENSENEKAVTTETFVVDPHGLNDGFFSIDEFNRQSEFLEQQDARGDPDEAAASDEEDVDWDADLNLLATRPFSTSKLASKDQDSGSEGDDEAGPVFGNEVDLDAPEGASDEEASDEEVDLDDMNGTSNTNSIFYKDFFAPPPKKGGKRAGKHGPPMKHNFPAKKDDEVEEDLNRAMSAVHRDIFSDDEVASDASEDGPSDQDPSNSKSNRSTHQRRQAKLLSEIRKLEAENIAKRSWTMSGEARAADRPLNSLLAEDLDFERAGKPVPVITQEVSEDIEELIKRRILAQEFDEVLRRRPDELLTGPLSRRGRMREELADTKSAKGLAEIYEEEHLAKTDPNYVDSRDEKLKKVHVEIEGLWKDVVGKLDSLCSWHYRPRPVEMSVQVRTDAPVVSLEDARPSGIGGGGDAATMSQLAPQEVYRVGEDKARDEVVTKGGAVVKRDELTREQKLRRRRREKERARKAGEHGTSTSTDGKKRESRKAKEKKEVVAGLKKGGAMVIGRKGELLDVEGNDVKRKGARPVTAGSLKL